MATSFWDNCPPLTPLFPATAVLGRTLKRKREVEESGSKMRRSSGSNLFDCSDDQLGSPTICTTGRSPAQSGQVFSIPTGRPVHLRHNLYTSYYGFLPATYHYHNVNIDANANRWCIVGSTLSHPNILKVFGYSHLGSSSMTVYTEIYDTSLALWLEKNASSLVDQYKRPTPKLQKILRGMLLGLQALEGMGCHLNLNVNSICIMNNDVKLAFFGAMEGPHMRGVPRRDVFAFRKIVFQMFKGSPPFEIVHLCQYLCENSHIPSIVTWHPSFLRPCERNSLRMRSHLYLVQKFDLHGFEGFHPGLSNIYVSPQTVWNREFKKWRLTINKEENPVVDWISPVRRNGTFVKALNPSYKFWNAMSYLRFSTNVIKHHMIPHGLTEAEMDNYLNHFIPEFMMCCFPWVHSFLEEV